MRSCKCDATRGDSDSLPGISLFLLELKSCYLAQGRM
jgi:hypothetical protein